MKRCVQHGPVTPMAEGWWHDILRMIPPSLVSSQHLQPHITELYEEVQKDYEASMKKAMGTVNEFYSSNAKSIIHIYIYYIL